MAPSPREEDVKQQSEWIRQGNRAYGGLIAIGVVMVQPFLTASSLDLSAEICAVAIPLLAALVMVGQQELYRRRSTTSLLVSLAKAVAQASAFVGVVAGFWHIVWFAGAGVLATGVVAVGVHSAGFTRLERYEGTCDPRSRRPREAPVIGPPTAPA
jgi:hypothetical protein